MRKCIYGFDDECTICPVVCPRELHIMDPDLEDYCDGIPHEQFDNKPLCEYMEVCRNQYESYNVVPGNPVFSKESKEKSEKLYKEQFPEGGLTFARATDYVDYDGIVINTIKHPFRFWWWLKSLFRKPRFSSSALERTENLITNKYKMIIGKELDMVNKIHDWGMYNPEYDPNHPDYKQADEDKRGWVKSEGTNEKTNS